MSDTQAPTSAHVDATHAGSDAFAEAGASLLSSTAPADDPLTRIAEILADLMRDSLDEAAAKAVRLVQLQRALGDDQLVSRDEAAALLRCHPKTVERYEREGVLPSAGRLGGTAVYSLGAIRAISQEAAAGRDASKATAAPKRGRPARGGR